MENTRERDASFAWTFDELARDVPRKRRISGMERAVLLPQVGVLFDSIKFVERGAARSRFQTTDGGFDPRGRHKNGDGRNRPDILRNRASSSSPEHHPLADLLYLYRECSARSPLIVPRPRERFFPVLEFQPPVRCDIHAVIRRRFSVSARPPPTTDGVEREEIGGGGRSVVSPLRSSLSCSILIFFANLARRNLAEEDGNAGGRGKKSCNYAGHSARRSQYRV